MKKQITLQWFFENSSQFRPRTLKCKSWLISTILLYSDYSKGVLVCWTGYQEKIFTTHFEKRMIDRLYANSKLSQINVYMSKKTSWQSIFFSSTKLDLVGENLNRFILHTYIEVTRLQIRSIQEDEEFIKTNGSIQTHNLCEETYLIKQEYEKK